MITTSETRKGGLGTEKRGSPQQRKSGGAGRPDTTLQQAKKKTKMLKQTLNPIKYHEIYVDDGDRVRMNIISEFSFYCSILTHPNS